MYVECFTDAEISLLTISVALAIAFFATTVGNLRLRKRIQFLDRMLTTTRADLMFHERQLRSYRARDAKKDDTKVFRIVDGTPFDPAPPTAA